MVYNMKKYSLLISIVSTLMISISVASAASLYINPASINKGIGNTFTVDLKIDVKELYTYDIILTYDKNILEATKVMLSFLNEPTTVVKNEINNNEGTVRIAVSSMPPALTKTGTGTLANVTFKVKSLGKTNIHFYDYLLLNGNVMDIFTTVKDGVFDNTVLETTTTSTTISKLPTCQAQGGGCISSVRICRGECMGYYDCLSSSDCPSPKCCCQCSGSGITGLDLFSTIRNFFDQLFGGLR